MFIILKDEDESGRAIIAAYYRFEDVCRYVRRRVADRKGEDVGELTAEEWTIGSAVGYDNELITARERIWRISWGPVSRGPGVGIRTFVRYAEELEPSGGR